MGKFVAIRWGYDASFATCAQLIRVNPYQTMFFRRSKDHMGFESRHFGFRAHAFLFFIQIIFIWFQMKADIIS